DELRGEKIDVIRWDADPITFISNALAPAKVVSVELFAEDGAALVIVPDYQLSLAIGREGQNVRLAARLTGWRLEITSEADAAQARERYLSERTRAVEQPAAEQPVEAVVEEETEAPAIDADLIRKLEEFKRERLGNGGEK
ncbi:MAG: hypothetical protein JO018_05770, partial [Candidatus Eremiobacteraeota bacterium]|nr:hypothetical protein [Candidatus Eremiobacteraeota bacterium]